ncbi:CRISPR-associated helicase Cas3' [Nannocystis sp. RBIL2]|uniref:type I-G CRISPR-associated helicase/endonuclease Cas3g n=1 Tax=Nannocystis sp. RBIL2 TaxID=2996788 RepID=UPI002270184D|nr:CRISPR-associated helicase Cas3' [Nannocystis sp. RBIL2]
MVQSRATFTSWFQSITGRPPYPYQEAFALAPELPDILSVPTGAGKTATAVLGWLWRRRFADEGTRLRTPRRLVFCQPMRTLVDQTWQNACAWLERAGLPAREHVFRLMGGAVEHRWDLHPDRDVVLVGTQDQLLSRALARGYAMSRYRWPWHFALLHNDCLWVIDEVQLMGVGLTTTAQLQGLRERLGTALNARTLWMSATLAEGSLATVDLRERPLTTLGLGDADRRAPGLARRLRAHKRLVRSDIRVTKKDPGTQALAAEVLAAHQDGTLTLVVVNRVARAQALFEALRRRGSGRVALIHSRFRPADRAAHQAPVLHPADDRPWTGILVATQAIEAGVDLDARLLFTELASWSSLVQRFGRCNRAGEYEGAEVRWIDVPDELAAPYTRDALNHARARLAALADVGPEALSGLPHDVAAPTPPALRRRDLLELFDTQPDLAGHDLDIARFVRDSDDVDVQLAFRTWPGDHDGAPPPADSPAPHERELVRVGVVALRDFMKKAGRPAAFRFSSEDGAWHLEERPVPGMTLLLPLHIGGYDPALGWTGDPSHHANDLRPSSGHPEDHDAADRWTAGCSDYVLLSRHAQDVAEELRALAVTIGGDHPWELLERAARWHDLGKVHPVFQRMLLANLPAGDLRHAAGPWAKSDQLRGARCERRGFRHELASALSYLVHHPDDDLGAYLVAAHHGKVRLSIRPCPNEQPPADPGRRFARGVWDGEPMPGADLGDGVRASPVTLRLDAMELGAHGDKPSWQSRVLALRDRLGPFRLAFYETLIRVADARGTMRHLPEESADA